MGPHRGGIWLGVAPPGRMELTSRLRLVASVLTGLLEGGW